MRIYITYYFLPSSILHVLVTLMAELSAQRKRKRQQKRTTGLQMDANNAVVVAIAFFFCVRTRTGNDNGRITCRTEAEGEADHGTRNRCR